MREVVYKNLTSARSGKKDVLLKEVFERDGVTAKTERRSFYFIKEVTHLKTDEELQAWVGSQNNRSEPMKRHFHIMKEHSDALGTDKFVCKILGLFYAVVDKDIYTIAFLHSFKINFARGSFIK
ncbi:MAG: hypothetical protein NT036_02960 [Candidatus Omnitrophica bacterium]|nr:hypothetical protein [Candidatus Omnitrophota bacterium]